MAENQEKDPMQKAMEDAEAAAAARKAARDAANAKEVAAQQALQAEELAGLQTYNTTQYENQGQIIKDIEGKLATAKEKDATAQKRENAYRYISGLGDTLSSLANLVGTAHGAANQQQTYNSSKVVQKAEEARKARKLEMDDLTKRQDEMKARLLEMKAAGSLKEAEIKARQAKENLALTSKHNAAEQAATQYDAAQIRQAGLDAQSKLHQDRTYAAQQQAATQAQENWQKTYNLQYAKFKEEQKGNNYNFTLANESVDIPKEKLNDVNVERIYQMLPEEIRKTIKGEQVTAYEQDEFGNSQRVTSHKAPSLTQKLAAIGAYADSNPTVKAELFRLAGKAATVETPVKQKEDGIYTGSQNALGTLSFKPETSNGKKKPNPMS